MRFFSRKGIKVDRNSTAEKSEENPMDMSILVIVTIPLFYGLSILILQILKPPMSRAVDITQENTEIVFALKGGHTILGVMDKKKSLCFFIGNDVKKSKDYE